MVLETWPEPRAVVALGAQDNEHEVILGFMDLYTKEAFRLTLNPGDAMLLARNIYDAIESPDPEGDQ